MTTTKIYIFEGRVTRVHDPVVKSGLPVRLPVTGDIVCVDPPGRTTSTIDFDLADIDPADHHLVVPGARFYYMCSERFDDSNRYTGSTDVFTMIRPRIPSGLLPPF